jgi:hypothetical protein
MNECMCYLCRAVTDAREALAKLLQFQGVDDINAVIGPPIQPVATDGRSHISQASRLTLEKDRQANPVVSQDDDSIQIIDPNTIADPMPVDPATIPITEGEDLVIVGQTGQVPSRDFPHARFSCLVFPFRDSSQRQKFCLNCYCFVCDVPAGNCTKWAEHCAADAKDKYWQNQRKISKKRADRSQA